MVTVMERHNKDSFNRVQHKEKRASNYIVILLQNVFLLRNSLWHRHFLNPVHLLMDFFSSMTLPIFPLKLTYNFSILNILWQGHFSEVIPFVHCSSTIFIWCLLIFFFLENTMYLIFHFPVTRFCRTFSSSQVIVLITVLCKLTSVLSFHCLPCFAYIA